MVKTNLLLISDQGLKRGSLIAAKYHDIITQEASEVPIHN